MNTVDKLITATNKLLGCEVISADYENFSLDVTEGEDDSYCIMCEDYTDMHNVLMSMLDGIRLCISVREQKGATE